MATILEKTGGLVAFVRTNDTGSFASAARLIGASPSAVSKSVARLEQRLGVRLLQRSTRTLSPTAEGAAYYERVAPHLRAIEEAEEHRNPDSRGTCEETSLQVNRACHRPLRRRAEVAAVVPVLSSITAPDHQL